ncbi:cupin domain-containing protein [Streptomyces fuscigenes]|uniref:cupin domain-containing protein n=1 Tax=Streptomyces fuscigenes TaxID=1528880 RepID=UPI001F23B964|nr:cupin domain-containing protein [Streptomyces fuscigenes]MCF3960562.1 cupin domain-containing protein [Streptomyces fuscigenes]
MPIGLGEALAGFEDLWSPRIVTRVNDYDVRVAKVAGDHVWHVHETTDEFFLVLDGELSIALREDAEPGGEGAEPGGGGTGGAAVGGGRVERTVRLERGAVFVVPRGVEHRPSAPGGASILMFEPTGTLSVGDRHDELPDHVDATTGHALHRP